MSMTDGIIYSPHDHPTEQPQTEQPQTEHTEHHTETPDSECPQHDHLKREGCFISGEIILSLSPRVFLQGDLFTNLDTYLTERIPCYNRKKLAIIWQGSSKECKSGTPTTLLVKVVIDLLAETEADSIKTLKAKDQLLLEIINGLNKDIRLKRAIGLRAASPNWLFSASYHMLGHTSPGGRPVPVSHYNPEAVPAPGGRTHHFRKVPSDTAVANRMASMSAAGAAVSAASQMPEVKRGEECEPPAKRPVNVVILDSAPPREKWNNLPAHLNHSFMQSVRKKLKVHYASDVGILLLPVPPANPHYSHKHMYDVSDHGLFIAGTIHEFEPTANLHIVEVMNQFGAASLETVAQGLNALEWIIDDKDTPLVVNCSFCFDALCNISGKKRDEVIETDHDLLALYDALRHLSNVFSEVRIIAAAGNDGVAGQNPPDTSYPAAFSFVIGVGAMEKTKKQDDGTVRVKRAWYSNRADSPPGDGIMVFGGKVNNVGGDFPESDETDGMLGIYIGDFVDECGRSLGTCKNGWAMWSGTSFSTGVVSGMFANAAALGCKINHGDPYDFYPALEAQAAPVPGGVVASEKWVDAAQG